MCAAPVPAIDPGSLAFPSEAEIRTIFAKSFAALSAAETEIYRELETYRALLHCIVLEAESRICPDDTSCFLHRQVMADAAMAQAEISNCIRHMEFALRTALALRNALCKVQ